MKIESATVAPAEEEIESATVAPAEKVYVYHGLEYRVSVTEMAAQTQVSVRTIKTYLKLRAMGYESHMMEGWTETQCLAHAGVKTKRKPAPTRADMDDAEYEITRLHGLVIELGGDPDAI